MMKRFITHATWVLVPAIAMTACGHKEQATLPADVKVEAICVKPSDMTMSQSYSGTVEESDGASLSFPVAGTLKQIFVSAGDRVAKGQLIATLDASTLQHAHEISVAALAQAQDAYDRMKQLHDANSLPDMQWVEVQNTLRQAQSAEAIARNAVDDARLYAPVSGYVSEKFIEPGMTVAPGLPVVKVVKINPIKVKISLPEKEMMPLVLGQHASITVDALGSEPVDGRLVEKGVAANPLTRAYDVKFEVANPDSKLLPGMICSVRTVSDDQHTAIVLPMQSVLLDADNRNFVWTVRNGHAHKQMIETDGLTDNGVVVASGIAQGDSVIVAGREKVSENTPVVVVGR